MSIASRLRQVRGTTPRKDFGARLSVHPNTVGNYESGREPPASYVAAVARSNNVRLEWLITGIGPMREGDEEPTFFQERLAYCISIAIGQYYGDNFNETPLDARAKILRAVFKYLTGMGVTGESIPDKDSLVGMVKLTGGLLGIIKADLKKPGRRTNQLCNRGACLFFLEPRLFVDFSTSFFTLLDSASLRGHSSTARLHYISAKIFPEICKRETQPTNITITFGLDLLRPAEKIALASRFFRGHSAKRRP